MTWAWAIRLLFGPDQQADCQRIANGRQSLLAAGPGTSHVLGDRDDNTNQAVADPETLGARVTAPGKKIRRPGRALGRDLYLDRSKVERLRSWLKQFRRWAIHQDQTPAAFWAWCLSFSPYWAPTSRSCNPINNILFYPKTCSYYFIFLLPKS